MSAPNLLSRLHVMFAVSAMVRVMCEPSTTRSRMGGGCPHPHRPCSGASSGEPTEATCLAASNMRKNSVRTWEHSRGDSATKIE